MEVGIFDVTATCTHVKNQRKDHRTSSVCQQLLLWVKKSILVHVRPSLVHSVTSRPVAVCSEFVIKAYGIIDAPRDLWDC